MIKRKLLITMTFLIGVLTFNANAQEYYETDMTSQFASLTLNSTWGGQYANTYYCPMVEVGGGLGMMNVVEKWSGSTVAPGTIMSATVTGLPTGTYKIELYGGAASTSLRDYMDSQLFSHTNNPVTGTAWVSGDSYTPEMALEYGDDINYPSSTGAELFAVSDGIEYCGQIPVYLATRFPDGAATITLDKIKVGNSGSVQIGIRITAPNTNWHFVQLKSVIAQLYDHLTDDVFHRWTAVVNGTISSDSPMLINNIGSEVEPGTTVYGNPNVECLEYADLSDYGRINISGDLGDDNSLRVILNCEEGNGSFVEITPTFFNGVATVYLNDLEYVHLNSIKAGGGTSNVNINSIDLMLKTSIEEARTKWQKAYDLATAALEAEAYKNVVGEERSNLQAEIDKEEPGSTDGYLQAGDLLLYATSIFKEAKSEYDALVISKDSLNVLLSSSIEILNVPSTDETYRESLKTEVETLFQSVDELTTTFQVHECIDELKNKIIPYIETVDPQDGYQFDLTSIYLVNPDVTDYWDGTWGIVPDGWYTDQIGNFQVMANEEMGPDGEVFIEYWSESPQANGQFNLYQKVTLPVGTYKMTGRLGAQQPTGGETSGIFFAANDVLGTNIPKGPLTDAELEFVNTEEQEVKIGMKAMTGNCLRWVGINKMRLFKLYTRPTLDFSEDSYLNVMSDISSADVHLSLATKAGEWMPVVLPFSVTLDQLKEFGGEGTEIVVLDTQYEDAIIFSPAESTQANVPFIIKTAKDVTSWTFEGCNVIKEDNPAQNGLFFNFIGNYTNGTAIPNNGYIYEEGEWKFGSGITFKAFHAYITYNTAQGAQVLPDVTFDGLDPKRIDAEELAVLSEVYENANGTDWNEKWQLDATPVTARNLPGITVSDGKVKGVSLASNNMEGEFPELLLTLQSVESIDISGNSLTGSLGSIETESPVKVLNISGNNFDGNIGQFVVNLNSLETLIASNNKITEVNPMISPNVTNLDLSSQKMDLVAELDLANLAEETLMASLPSILFYDHESQAYLPNVTLNCSDGDDFKYSMVYEDGSLGMNLISSNNVYKALNDDILDVATPGGDTFKIHISYPMGDSNFNGCFDVADLMTTINFIFEEYKTKPFNFVAANFNNDDIINVQDVVLTVDGLLAQEQEEVGGEAPRRIQGEVATAEAMIFWRGNDLVLNTSVPVSALDINVESEGNIDWMFKSAGLTFKTRTNENRHHVVAYSMSGATLPVGETVIARVSSTADIINVVACDKAAQYVNVVISNDDTTGIESITAESENNGIYDLTGRKLQRANVKAGIYIIDGKKMIIR